MPDITILPANLATLVLESCLYGILLLLFISTVYFLATRRTLAGMGSAHTSRKHHFTSLVFIGVATLFLVVTAHWILDIYQAFFAFIHLGSATAEDTFYADLAQPSEVAKTVLFSVAVLIGDALVIYRLWIIWGRNPFIPIFPVCSLVGVFVTSIGIIYEFSQWKPELRGAAFHDESKPWAGSGFVLSLLINVYSTGFIAFRISRVNAVKVTSDSRLMSFLSIVVESAGLQTFWLGFSAVTIFASSDAEFIASDTFPAVIGIANLLIHARVGLGWSAASPGSHAGHTAQEKSPQGRRERESV
ncbi:hypothetical protein B0H11DRAFT_2018081 [Mycena galericulata]|nr:hypothetical protein B0H11DRAFT_2018081 [Mycena galericulata]